jgi:selenocysteine-specific elongation factor
MWELVLPALMKGGFAPPPVAELATTLKLKEAALKDFLHRKSRGGEVMRVPPDRFYPRATLAALAATAQAVARAIDTLGITQRLGDARKLRKDFVPILGAAEPARPPVKPAAGAQKTPSQRKGR